METMQIIPVLDLMNGQVVQGLRGERERYRPLQSELIDSTEPLAVARALLAETGCRAMYVADLDAIQGQGDHGAVIGQLAAGLPVEFWVDAGAADVASARRVLENGAARVIIGSETLPDLESLRAIQAAVPAQQRLFSLDLAGGRVLSRSPELRGLMPADGLARVAAEGWSTVIVLTLDRVGTGSGLDWSLLAAAKTGSPQLALIAGGGVRAPADLRALAETGLNGVLVATALHRGWITRRDLQPSG